MTNTNDEKLRIARTREKMKYQTNKDFKEKKKIAMKLYRQRIKQDETLREKNEAYQKAYQKAYRLSKKNL